MATSSSCNFMCMQWIVLDIAIASLGFIICMRYATMLPKFQCINDLSYTHNNEFILNALLECVLLA